MGINLDEVRNRLQALQQTTNKQTALWKPQAGKSQVRIVPYKFNRENPFIELYFHYGIAKRPYLSPITFGRPDPIVEFSDKLKATGDKDDWKMGKKLEPKMRTYVPVVVRGEENQGVKFWGFGKLVYEELLGVISDPDYGDISDPISGRDVSIEFKTAEEVGKNFPQTTIRVKPNQSPLTENKETMIKLFENQKDIIEVYPEPSYEELEQVLQDWLNPDESDSSDTVDVEQVPSAQKSNHSEMKKTTSVEDAFDELFNS